MQNVTVPQELLDDQPSLEEVEKVLDLWSMFNSTTQFLHALKLVMLDKDLPTEAAIIEATMRAMASTEAVDLNVWIEKLFPANPPALPRYGEH